MALSPTASTPTSEGDNSGDLAVVFVDGMTLSVLELSIDFVYTIPSFSVISVNLRQAEIHA